MKRVQGIKKRGTQPASRPTKEDQTRRARALTSRASLLYLCPQFGRSDRIKSDASITFGEAKIFEYSTFSIKWAITHFLNRRHQSFCWGAMTSKSDISITIGKNIRLFRKAQGLTQVELGDRTGIDAGDISRIERGLIDIQVINLVKIARALNLQLSQLYHISF